jgi:hypothetical protein
VTIHQSPALCHYCVHTSVHVFGQCTAPRAPRVSFFLGRLQSQIANMSTGFIMSNRGQRTDVTDRNGRRLLCSVDLLQEHLLGRSESTTVYREMRPEIYTESVPRSKHSPSQL